MHPKRKDEADHQSHASIAEEESQAAPGLFQAIVEVVVNGLGQRVRGIRVQLVGGQVDDELQGFLHGKLVGGVNDVRFRVLVQISLVER